jgi:hypothetical protein
MAKRKQQLCKNAGKKYLENKIYAKMEVKNIGSET